jgi:dehydrogenase/reductase SDR family protein 1
LALVEKAGSDFLAKANGKTLFTAELAEQFGFSEDHDTDGAINRARLEGLQPFKAISANRLAQYNLDAPLPRAADTNNSDFANLFPGAKKFHI